MRKPVSYTAADGKVTWRVRFRMGHGRSARQASETFDSEKAALRFAKLLDAVGSAEALKTLHPIDEVPELAPTLGELAADHIKYQTGIEPGTRLGYERLWKRTWSPLIGSVRADSPNLDDEIKAATNTLALRYSYKSLKNQRGLLHGVLDRGVEKGHITKNPAKKLRLPRGTSNPDLEDDHEMRLLTQEQFALLASAIAPRYRTLVLFLAGTGCRWGEAVALRVKDLALDEPVVRIRRALKWSSDGARVVGVPKSSRSKRTIALPVEIVPALRQLVEGKGQDDLVFSALRGGMIQHRTFWSDHWRPAIFRAQTCGNHLRADCRCGSAHPERCPAHKTPPGPCGCHGTLPLQPRIHDLRHSHASWLLAAGIPIHVVQIRLGHESIQTTVDTYGHLLPDAQIQAAKAAAIAFAPPALGL